MTGVNMGPLNEKVGFQAIHSFNWATSNSASKHQQIVSDLSSTLDDPREHAETISANHMDMCRFSTIEDKSETICWCLLAELEVAQLKECMA